MANPFWSSVLLLISVLTVVGCVGDPTDPPAPNACRGVVCAADACHAAGVCNPSTGLCSSPAKADGTACDDGNACTAAGSCRAGTCVGESPVTCGAASPCHVATCDRVTGKCRETAQPDGATCDDGNACTKVDACRAGACVGADAVVCAADDACHDVGVCDPSTGKCSKPVSADGASCSDGNGCTQTDVCQGGACVGSNPVVCAAQDACHTAGACAPATGQCTNPAVADATPCDDANACTQQSQCLAGVCTGASPVVCAAQDQCHTAGVCSPSSGCSQPAVADGTACDDGNADVPVDACVGGACTPRPATCRQLQLARLPMSLGDGTYTLYGPGGPRQAYCDMTTEGGGWTALFVGANGSPNVFDRFDVGAHAGTFNDPTALRYLQRAPAQMSGSAAEIAVSCGGAKVKFAATEPVRRWLFDGVQSGWQPVTSTVLAGTIGNLPNALWTGTGTSRSFILSRDRASLGNTFASSYDENASYDYCNGAPDTTSIVRLYYRELGSPPVRNANVPGALRASCLAIRDAGGAQGDGLYWIAPESTPYLAYCDMTRDGGGWTATFAGRNGSTNVFGHLDTSMLNTPSCTDPATRCLRRAPASIGTAATQVAVECGASMVRFTMTEQLRSWLVNGVRQNWIPLTPTVVAGTLASVPNTLFTGVSDTSQSFIFARNQASLGNTFASSYSNSDSYDYCAGIPDQASLVRIYYREASATPALNTVATAASSCRVLRDGGSTVSGDYHLLADGGGTYLAYCDMTSDGGGWTAAYAGRNGSVNVFDHFDTGVYQGTCTDPATRCLRRSPAPIGGSATDIAVSCGAALVKFPMTEQVRGWLGSGVQRGWIPLTPTVVSGNVVNVPNSLFTGDNATSLSFIVARDRASLGNTFASSYANNDSYDYCSGTPDQASSVRLFYRESSPTPVRNTVATAGATCRALRSGGATASGLYHLLDGVGATYLAYCDMTSDGGGWTTLFAGRNGSVNVFDHFDVTSHQGTCADPATRCVRRAQPTVGDSAADVLVSCGSAQVRFALTEQMRAWLARGTQQNWITLTPIVVAGTVANVPNTLYTGVAGGEANASFIFARSQASLGNTFAASYAGNASFDYCNGVPDQASAVRVSFREVDPEPLRNAPAEAQPSCLSLRGAGFAQTGLYWLAEPAGTPYQAYCDMTSDGGGWTATFAGRNGSPNVFDRFDTGHVGTCTAPATHCLRRLPASAAAATELAVACGAALVRFPMVAGARNFLTSGAQAGWVALTPTVVAGTFANVPNSLWTGDSGSDGFIFSRDRASLGNTFAASYDENGSFDYCANAPNAASLVRLFYR